MKRNMLKGIKNRKITRYVIKLWHSDGKNLRHLYVTKRQLERLNAIEVGREVFLSHFYASQGGDCWALRTEEGLMYMPWMCEHSDEGVEWLKKLYAITGR